ncbi:MAG: cation:proton antiporter regulatory subunit, partial [Miltoncostaeaceae bacterium]
MIAVLTLVVVVLLSLVITRMATVALTLTGMSSEAARFQARSALTGAGFTTSESEAVVNHPVRRRIVLFLMLLGSAGLVTVLATLIFTFTQAANTDEGLQQLGIIIGALFVIWLFARSRLFDRLISPSLARLLGRAMKLELGDYHGLLHLADGYTVREMAISDDHWMADRTLGELELRQEGVLVLGLQCGGQYLGAPTAPVMIKPGDVCVLYGSHDALDSIDGRGRGDEGDAAHAASVVRHR